MAVIDELEVIEKGESKIVDSADNGIIDEIEVDNNMFHFAKESEAIGTCDNAVEEPIIDLKISGNSVQSNLPSEYQEVEYLESSGTQYIDTNFKPNQNSSIELYGYQKTTTTNSLFGSNPYFVLTSKSDNYRFRYNNNTIDTTVPSNTLVWLRLAKNKAYINNELVGEFTEETFQANHNALLFARASEIGRVEEINSSRIYNVKLWDGDTLIRDYVACYRKQDNVAGLYDKVNDVFYINSGTGEFIVGSNVEPTPDAPIEVESVGEKTKNLFDYSKWENGTKTTFNGVDCLLIKDSLGYTYTIDGDSSTEYMFTFKVYRDEADVSKKTNLKNTSDDRNIVVNIVSGGTYSGVVYGGETLIFTGWGTNLYIDLTVTQLEKGTEATPFEPYGYKVPINISGKNLLDYTKLGIAGIDVIDNGVRVSGYALTTSITPEMFLEMTGLKEGDQITMSFNKRILNGRVNTMFGVFMFYKNANAEAGTQDYYIVRLGQQDSPTTTMTSTIPTGFNSKNYGKMYVYGGFAADDGSAGQFEITNIQIEKGNVATAYEPYFNKTINIYLNEPLRKIGDYADYIDYKNKKVIRNISEMVLDGTRTWVKYDAGSFNSYFLASSLFKIGTQTSLCNKFENIDKAWSQNKTAYSDHNTLNRKYFQISDSSITSVEDWQNWLSINKPILTYVLATPTEEPIDIPEMSTEKGTNNFVVNTTLLPSEIKINYWKQI